VSSQAHNITIKSDSEPEILSAQGWTEVSMYLESGADGENRVGFGSGELTLVEPGVSFRHILAPGTILKFKTTSLTGVTWTLLTTELKFLDALEQALCSGGGL